MRILHTSDWHIGRLLYGRRRYHEFSAFLDWLADIIRTEPVDALLVSGDIFDTSTPSNRAQQLYYRFLCRVAASGCDHIVIIAGNHDSPSFLNAPRELLKALNVHVVGSITDPVEDEVIVLSDRSGSAQAIVCAVPYLRDRDVRTAESGESIDDKTLKLVEGVRAHYAAVGAIAREKQQTCGPVPIIGMGHLFAAGGTTIEGDGVRELYVGSLAHVGKDVFPACMDYVALGHLHVPQTMGKSDHIRYAGSPIPMGYGEAGQVKSIVRVDFTGNPPAITLQRVPCFQALERLSGDLETILQQIENLKSDNSTAWLEIEYLGTEIAATLRTQIEDAVAGSGLEVRRIKNQRVIERVIRQTGETDTLDNLDVNEVFTRLLDTHEVPASDRPSLIQAYTQTLNALYEQDANAE